MALTTSTSHLTLLDRPDTADHRDADVEAGLTTITVARGDGIGPEIMHATLRVLEAAGAPLRYEEVEVGERVYRAGHTSGIAPETWATIRRNRALLKGPITTPQGSGYKSLNVTIRKTLNLFANVRPTASYAPFVTTSHPDMDLVIVRENEEDLYAGIEHQQTQEVAQVLKLVTRPGSERIIRYAFEYARAHNRRRVTCMTKDNIMKHTDGLFHRIFNEVSADYPDIEADHQIIDIGAARLAAQPDRFDVIVTLNLYGDILSDIASQVAGSVGLAGSANIGADVAMFEAVHGSAPDIAGMDIANPAGLIEAACQMLVHVGAADYATTIANALLATIESGIHTADLYDEATSTRLVGTAGFADAVIERLGRRPTTLAPVTFRSGGIQVEPAKVVRGEKELVGVDVFVEWDAPLRDPELLASRVATALPAWWQLDMITNRGVKVFPDGAPETYCTDHWRCRLLPVSADHVEFADVLTALRTLDLAGLDVIKTEHLYRFDGTPGFSLGQGQ